MNETINLIPFGDVHWGSYMYSKKRWGEFLSWAKTKKNCYFLGMGDYFDTYSTSERKILKDDKLHESTLDRFDTQLMSNTLHFKQEIEFMKGKLIGMIEGNHFGTFASTGITTTQKLSEMLNTKYLGVCSLIHLQIIVDHTWFGLDIFAHHGRGGGRTLGGGMNVVTQMENVAIADIYLMGDNHQKGLVDKDLLKPVMSHGKVLARKTKRIYTRTGSFLKGYENNKASYVTDGLFPPTNMGVVKFYITPKRMRIGGDDESYLDIHASL